MSNLIYQLALEATPLKRRAYTIVPHRWYGGGEPVESENTILKSVFEELNRASDRGRLNPALELTSDRAHAAAKRWILWATNKFSLINPSIVIPGDGGLIVEWYNKDSFISVSFDKDDEEMDTIFYQLDNKRNSVDFDETKMEELINELISDDQVSPNFTYRQTPFKNRISNQEFWADFSGTSSTAYAT